MSSTAAPAPGRSRLPVLGGVLLLALGWSTSAAALNLSVPRVNGDDAQVLLGDGTGVIIGVVDSGVDDTHPALTGVDSQGMTRLVAEENFVASEGGNTGDDVIGRGTAVTGVVLGDDPGNTNSGMAPDARYVNARVLDSSGSFATDAQVVNGAGFALDNGADVLNISLNLAAVGSDASSRLSEMADYISFALDIPVVVSAGNNGTLGTPGHRPRGPADGFNVFSVAATEANAYDQIADFSSFGQLEDGRLRPNISAPGQSIATANDDWEGVGEPLFEDWGETNIAAPHVSGLLASQIEFGRANGLSTDPILLRATVLNSAEKVDDPSGNPWEPFFSTTNGLFSTQRPLDEHSGTGQIDGQKLAEQYVAGEQAPGLVDPVGWDVNSLSEDDLITYEIDEQLQIGSTLTATLVWDRHVGINDGGTIGVIDSADTFFQSSSLNDLNLEILLDGVPIAESVSTVDNIEHLHLTVDQAGTYAIRVVGESFLGVTTEEFAVAWFGTGTGSSTGVIPEPGSLVLLALGLVALRRGFAPRSKYPLRQDVK